MGWRVGWQQVSNRGVGEEVEVGKVGGEGAKEAEAQYFKGSHI